MRYGLLLFAGFSAFCGTVTPAGEAFPIAVLPRAQSHPNVWGYWVVWEDSRNADSDVYAKDLATGQEVPISTAAGAQSGPTISGNWIAWSDNRNGDWDIFGYDRTTGAEVPLVVRSGPDLAPVLHAQTSRREPLQNRWRYVIYMRIYLHHAVGRHPREILRSGPAEVSKRV